MATFISTSPEETLKLGERWGREARPGWVIALSGDLGSGKTRLVKGIALGLGVTDRVHSPSFVLLNEYNGGRWPLFHLDLYRLETREQIIRAGLEACFDQPEGITVIEWAERWFSRASKLEGRESSWRLRRVGLEVLSERERRIVYEDFGP